MEEMSRGKRYTFADLCKTADLTRQTLYEYERRGIIVRPKTFRRRYSEFEFKQALKSIRNHRGVRSNGEKRTS